jgi:hypothetical protein
MIARRPRVLHGTALGFGVWTTASCEMFPDASRVLFAPGCLDRSLRRIAARRDHCDLVWGHGGVVLASTRDGCLDLFTVGNHLHLALHGKRLAGRMGIAAVVAGGRHGLSVGGQGRRLEGNPIAVVVVEATLSEIALCERPACPGCTMLF